MTAETLPKSINHTADGKFAPGNCANPGGRPKGTNKALQEIEDAIKEFEKEKGVSYWKAATLIAMKLANEGNPSLLGKILDKFVSSKILHEGEGLEIANYVIVRNDVSNKTVDSTPR